MKLFFIVLVVVLSGCSLLEKLTEDTKEDQTPAITEHKPTPQPTVVVVVEEKQNPTCNAPLPTRDGGGGFVMKNGEHTGNVVVILPGKFLVAFDSVTMVKKDGSEEYLQFSGWANPDHNGNRQHWRGKLPIKKYKTGSRIVAKHGENTCIWPLPDKITNNRID